MFRDQGSRARGMEFWSFGGCLGRNLEILDAWLMTCRLADRGGLDMLHLLGADHEVRPLCNGLRGRVHT